MKAADLIIWENEDFVVVNKPAGMLTIPDREGVSGLKNLLKDQYGSIFTVHRLDKDTSGIVVFAKNELAHKHLSLQFEHRSTLKIYVGFVLGSPAQNSAIINEALSEHPVKKGLMIIKKKGKESITEYEVAENFRLYSWMRFKILTGRTHQIRVHMKQIGHPIVCDALYGDGKPVFISRLKSKYNLSKDEEEERPVLKRLALHASALSFTGLRNELHNIEAPLPKDLKALLQQLRKTSRSHQ